MTARGTAHPKAWTTRAEVTPDLLPSLRVPRIGGGVCVAPIAAIGASATVADQVESQGVAAAGHVQGRQTLAPLADVLRSSGRGGSEAGDRAEPTHSGLTVLSPLPGKHDSRQQVSRQLKSSLPDEQPSVLSQLHLLGGEGPGDARVRRMLDALSKTPLPSSCPLFARKFASGTAEMVSIMYAQSVLLNNT